MTHLRGPTALYDIAWLGLSQINTDLGDNAVDRVNVYPGEIVWDHAECGLLAASIGPLITSDSFPVPAGVGWCGGATFVGTITWAVVRCAPQPTDEDIAPTVEALDAAAALAASDQWHLYASIDCVLGILKDEVNPANVQIIDSLMAASTISVQGDAVGAQVIAQVQFMRGVN